MNEEARTEKPAEGPEAYRYWAFISYSHADEAWAAWIHRALERYRVPRGLVRERTTMGPVPRRLYPVFRDRDELPSSASLNAQVHAALKQSRALVVVCSPHAAASRWVNEEVRAWQALGRAERVFCLIVDGEPNASSRPDSGLLEAFPEAVRMMPGGGAGDRAEPLAADVRPGKDGPLAAKLKLAAGILGVRFDELRRRDRRRRRWRIAQAAALAVLVLATIGAVWYRGQRATRLQEQIAQARAFAARSYAVPAGDEAGRLRVALEAVEATGTRRAVPEAEVALYRALSEWHHIGTFAERDTVADFGGWSWPVTFDANGRRAAVASAIGATIMLDSLGQRAAVLRDAEMPYQNDYGVTYLAGDTLLTAGSDGFVRTWTPSGELRGRFRAHEGDVLSVGAGRDGTVLTVGCDEGAGPACEARSARLFDRSGDLRATFTHPGGLVTSAVTLRDGRILTAGSGGLRFWSRTGGLESEVAGDPRWVSARSFAADGRFVTGGCDPWHHAGMFAPLPPLSCDEPDARVELRDAHGHVRASFAATVAALSPEGASLALVEHACDPQLRCSATVALIDTAGSKIAEWPASGRVSDIAFDPAAARVAVALGDGPLSVLDAFGNPIADLGADARTVTSVEFSPDGQRLAVVSCPHPAQGACLGRQVDLWDPDGADAATYAFRAERHPRFSTSAGDAEPVVVGWTGRGGLLIARNDGTDPRILASDGSVQAVLPIGPALVRRAWVDADGERLLLETEENVRSFSEPRSIALWDARGRRIAVVARDSSDSWPGLVSARFGPDEGTVTATADGVLHRLDREGRELDSVRASESRIVDLAVSTDGQIASVDTAGTVRVWSAALEPRASFSAASAGDRDALRWDFGYVLRFTPAASGLVVAGPTTMGLRALDGASRWSVALDRVDLAPPVAAGELILVVVCTERGRGVTIGSTTSCYDSRIDSYGPDGQLQASLTAPGGVETMFSVVDATPDGGRIAGLSVDGQVLLWTGRGDFIGEVSRGANALAFSPDAARLAVGKAGGVVEVHAIWPDIEALVREARRRLEQAESGT